MRKLKDFGHNTEHGRIKSRLFRIFKKKEGKIYNEKDYANEGRVKSKKEKDKKHVEKDSSKGSKKI